MGSRLGALDGSCESTEKNARRFVLQELVNMATTIDDVPLPWGSTVEHLGVVLDKQLTWRHHVQRIK